MIFVKYMKYKIAGDVPEFFFHFNIKEHQNLYLNSGFKKCIPLGIFLGTFLRFGYLGQFLTGFAS